MSYPWLLTVHLMAALVFIGAVFFEVLFLDAVRGEVSRSAMSEVQLAIGRRARRLMPWILIMLYGAGMAMAWQYRQVLLAQPFASGFGTLLSLKIALAVSVLGHFVVAITWSSTGAMTGPRLRFIHRSVFCHMLVIVWVAKNMFHAG